MIVQKARATNEVVGNPYLVGNQCTYHMHAKIGLILACSFLLACSADESSSAHQQNGAAAAQIAFDVEMWQAKDGDDYLYRTKLVDAVLYYDSIRTLTTNGILNYLGNPDYKRETTDHWYYRISEQHLGKWTLHTQTIVIKFHDGNTVEWIKLRE
jgi:hypothetical protein